MAGFLRTETAVRVVNISVDRLQPSPHQPRRVFSHEELRSLADSIRQDGILQPLTVRAQGIVPPNWPGFWKFPVSSTMRMSSLLQCFL